MPLSLLVLLLLFVLSSLIFAFGQKSQIPELANAEFDGIGGYLSGVCNDVFGGCPELLYYATSDFRLSVDGPISKVEWQTITPWIAKRIKEIHLSPDISANGPTYSIEVGAPTFPNVRRIYGYGEGFTFAQLEPLFFSCGPNLTSLVIPQPQLNADNLKRIGKHYPNLKQLNFVPTPNLQPQGVWQNFPKLDYLRVSGDSSLPSSHLDAVATHCPEILGVFGRFDGSIAKGLRHGKGPKNFRSAQFRFLDASGKLMKLNPADVKALRKRFPRYVQ